MLAFTYAKQRTAREICIQSLRWSGKHSITVNHTEEKNISQTVWFSIFIFLFKKLQFDFKNSLEMEWCLKSSA